MSATTISQDRSHRPNGTARPPRLEIVYSDSPGAGEPIAARERILIVETDISLQNHLARELLASDCEVLIATTGEQAFSLLRNWLRPIDWLYTRANLPGMIDGWILADEHHDHHPDHPAIIGAHYVRPSTQGHVVLQEPTAAVALEAIRRLVRPARSQEQIALIDDGPRRIAA